MVKNYETDEIIIDKSKNIVNGNLIKKLTVSEWLDLLHHTHDGSVTTEEQTEALTSVLTQISTALSESFGVDTTEIDAAIAEIGSSSSEDNGDSDEPNEDDELNADLPESSSYFSTIYSTETEVAAVAALEASIESDEEENVFESVVDEEESVLGEYLGCYEVTAETGVLTLASPVEVTDPEVYTAIVLHYNDETGEWEQVSDVQIIDGYVYAVFTSLSPIAVYTVKKKYAATVTVGETVTYYETIAEAVTYAEANLASAPVITLTWNKYITETIGPLYSTADGTVTFDLAGYTIYASVEGGYAINISGDASTVNVVVQNGSIIADEVTLGTINITDVYAALNELNLTASCVGGSNVVIDSVKAPMTDCVVTTENGNGIEIKATNTASLITIITTSTITTTNTGDNKYPAILLANVNSNAFTININTGCVITGDVYGVYNDSVAGKCYYYGEDAYLIAPIAVYVSENHTAANGFYTGTSKYPYINGTIVSDDNTDGTEVIAIRFAYLNQEVDEAYVGSGYGVYDSEFEDETYPYIATQRRVVECTTTDGTVTYKNKISSDILSAAGTGGTAKLLEDTSNTGMGSINVDNVTLDLNGHTFTVTSSSGIYCTSKDYAFTIKNGNLVSTCKTEGCAALKFTRGTLNVEDVNITTVDDGSINTNAIVIGNGSADYAATANITGSTVINAPTGILIQNKTGATNVATLNVGEGVVINGSNYAISGNGSYDGTVININGGTFNCTSSNGAALYHPQAGTLTINGGTFEAVCTGIQICDGNAVINNATVAVTGSDEYMASKTGDGNIPDGAALSVVNRSGYSSTYPTLKVYGGKFSGQYALRAYSWASNAESEWADAGSYIDVSGGDFSNVIDNTYLAEGYACAAEAVDGYYTVAASA